MYQLQICQNADKAEKTSSRGGTRSEAISAVFIVKLE